MKPNKISLFLFLLASFFIQFLGTIFTASSVSQWYSRLNKASWTPPPWVFGPVWTILYILIGIGGWLIYISPPSKLRKKALTLYWIQLVINCFWSYFFFYLRSPLLGFVDIVLLCVLTGIAIALFWRISQAAFWLFIPYFIWIVYAATLNGAIWILNLDFVHF